MRIHTEELSLRTRKRAELVNITPQVEQALSRSGVSRGVVTVFVLHTTAGVTVNENADPDVGEDLLAALEQAVPWNQSFYRHGEGNSAAHAKSSMVGCSQTLLAEGGKLALGTWQGVWFCEFDGPRSRQVIVRVMGE